MARQRDNKGHFIKDGDFPRQKDCANCGKSFACRSLFKYQTSRVCSIACLGILNSQEKKGKNPYQRTIETNLNMSRAKKGISIWEGKREGMDWVEGEKSKVWKGENVGYSSLHKWIYRNLGKPSQCEHCATSINVVWANISHLYKRSLDDWMQLCGKCHKKYDRGALPAKMIFEFHNNNLGRRVEKLA